MYYIGIDIGGTNLKAGLVDENYRITATRKQPLQFTSMEQMGDTLAKMAIDLVEENHVPRDQVASVGMGFPGPVCAILPLKIVYVNTYYSCFLF